MASSAISIRRALATDTGWFLKMSGRTQRDITAL